MSVAPVATPAPVAPPASEESSWFSFGSKKPVLDENGQEKPASWGSYIGLGGKRRKPKMRGGTPFRPFVARSVALNASPFKGGRRRKTRRHKKRSRRHSRRR